MSDPCDPPGYLSSDPGVERLMDNVQAIMPGLTTDMTTLAIWNTIEDFYQRSTLRREHLYWEMPPGVLVVDFDPFDQNWRVCRFLAFNGLLNVKFETPGRIRDLASPTPTNKRDGEVILALKPSSLQTPLPYDVWTQWFEALLAGVLYRLYLQPGKPYSDIQGARLNAALYRAGIASARALAQANNVTGGSSWSFPYFARGRQLSQGWGWMGRHP
jgi:hypothetical protein